MSTPNLNKDLSKSEKGYKGEAKMRALIEYLETASAEGRLAYSMEEITECLSGGYMHPGVVSNISEAFSNDKGGFSADYFAAYVEWQKIIDPNCFD